MAKPKYNIKKLYRRDGRKPEGESLRKWVRRKAKDVEVSAFLQEACEQWLQRKGLKV